MSRKKLLILAKAFILSLYYKLFFLFLFFQIFLSLIHFTSLKEAQLLQQSCSFHSKHVCIIIIYIIVCRLKIKLPTLFKNLLLNNNWVWGTWWGRIRQSCINKWKTLSAGVLWQEKLEFNIWIELNWKVEETLLATLNWNTR